MNRDEFTACRMVKVYDIGNVVIDKDYIVYVKDDTIDSLFFFGDDVIIHNCRPCGQYYIVALDDKYKYFRMVDG